MDPLTIGLLIASAVSVATSAGSAIYNAWSTKKTNEQNEQLMREGWARDDVARGRMVSDLENAGLSKWLATGASPMTSSPVSLQTPQLDMSKSADALSHMFQNASAVEHTSKQNEILDKQGEVLTRNAEILETEKAIKDAEKRIKEHDANVFENRSDVASTDPAWMKYISEGLNTVLGRNNTGEGMFSGAKAFNAFKEQAKQKHQAKVELKEHKKDEKYVEQYHYERRKPMTQSQWMTQHNIPRTGENAQIYAKEYAQYVNSYYKDSRARR